MNKKPSYSRARCVLDDMRDNYFKTVADELRDERDNRGQGRKRNQDVKRAVMIARQKCGATIEIENSKT